jgi:hypothetical protein
MSSLHDSEVDQTENNKLLRSNGCHGNVFNKSMHWLVLAELMPPKRKIERRYVCSVVKSSCELQGTPMYGLQGPSQENISI